MDLLKERVSQRHAKQLNEDPEIWVFLTEEALDNASPQSLRELAATMREDGDLDGAYDIETLAGPSRTRRTVLVARQKRCDRIDAVSEHTPKNVSQ
jgi:hypothetical protein